MCTVENSVVWDFGTTLIYPVMRVVMRWPGRGVLLAKVLHGAFGHTAGGSDADDTVLVNCDDMVSQHVMHGHKRSATLLKWYSMVCPSMVVRFDPDDPTKIEEEDDLGPQTLDHRKLQLYEMKLDAALYKAQHVEETNEDVGVSSVGLKSESLETVEEELQKAAHMEEPQKADWETHLIELDLSSNSRIACFLLAISSLNEEPVRGQILLFNS